MSAELQSLSAPESADKSRLEHVVEAGIRAGTQANKALLEIRDRRLYRDESSTFADYLQSRWGMSRARGYQLIAAVEVAESLPERHMGTVKNERQARAIAAVPEAKRGQVLDIAAESGGPVTAAKIQKAAAEVAGENVYHGGHDEPKREQPPTRDPDPEDEPDEPAPVPGEVISEPLPGDDSVAMYRARMAVQELELIPPHDPGRSEALLWVALQISNMPQ